MNNKKQSIITKIPLLAYKHPVIILVLLTLITIGSLYTAKNITLDADLSALLPDSFSSVQDLEKVKNRFGGIGYVVVTIRGQNPEAMRHLADKVALETKTIENVGFVDYRRPVDFFKDRALYYLEVEDLKIIEKRIKKRWKWEKKQRNPMYVDLEGGPAPSVEFQDIQDKYNDENSSSWMSAQQSEEAYYFNDNKTFLAVFIKPDITSSDLGLSEKVLSEVESRIEKIDLSAYDSSLKMELTGRYKKKIDLQAEMKHDMGIASVVSLCLVLAYLLLHFRRLEAIVLIALPLIFGIVCTFAFASLAFGQLNILTAFIGVILLGLGIDHGIHLLSRYRDEMHGGNAHTATIYNTFVGTGKSVAVAALTTFIIFLGLSFSEFRAFYEFGIIASAGMILIMVSYLVLMPALLRIINHFTWRFDNGITQRSSLTGLYKFHKNNFRMVIIFSSILILIFGFKIKDLNFNYDFESLGNSNLPSFQLDKEVNDLLGYSQTPMVALTDNLEEEFYVSERFRDNQIQLGEESGVDFLLATADLIPVKQAEKQKILKKIRRTVNRVKDSWLEDDEVTSLNELKKTLKSKPFVYADLPIEIKQLFGRQNQNTAESATLEQGAIMLFAAISLSDGNKVIQLADELRQVKQHSGERVAIAGESMILADILNLIFREAPKVLAISIILIFSILWFFLRRIEYALIALVPAVSTIVLTLGIMGLVGIELNYINMIMIPILLGIGVDSGVHMVNRAIDGNKLQSIIDETGMAIFGSIVTSGLGLGALLLTNHPGLNSLAYIAILGLSINLLISVLVLPSLIEAKIKFQQTKQPTRS